MSDNGTMKGVVSTDWASAHDKRRCRSTAKWYATVRGDQAVYRETKREREADAIVAAGGRYVLVSLLQHTPSGIRIKLPA